MSPVKVMTEQTYRLHHIGLLVPQIESAAAFLEGEQGFTRETGIITDATQTARVCFLRQPGQSHWLELVTPHGENSKLSRALKQGAGPHHLAFEVPSLARAVAHLRSRGYWPLGQPEPGAAFGGRLIAWMYSQDVGLTELVERGSGPLVLPPLA